MRAWMRRRAICFAMTLIDSAEGRSWSQQAKRDGRSNQDSFNATKTRRPAASVPYVCYTCRCPTAQRERVANLGTAVVRDAVRGPSSSVARFPARARRDEDAPEAHQDTEAAWSGATARYSTWKTPRPVSASWWKLERLGDRAPRSKNRKGWHPPGW